MTPTQPPKSRQIEANQTLRPAEVPDTIPAPPDSRVPLETAIRPRHVAGHATPIPGAPRVPSDIVELLEPTAEDELVISRRMG